MKHILVPVDLSRNSKEALTYAVELAHKSHAAMTVIHLYSLLLRAIMHSTNPEGVDKDPGKWIQQRIREIKLRFPNLDIAYRVVKGDAGDDLAGIASSIDADLIITGCQGAREDNKTFLGSVASSLILTSKIPVMLIPPRSKFHGVHHILVAAVSSQVKEKEMLEPLKFFVDIFHPKVSLLQFGEYHEVKRLASLKPLVTHTEYSENQDYMETVNAFMANHPTDLLTVVRRKKGFLEKTIGPKRTSAMRFNTPIPLLVLIEESL